MAGQVPFKAVVAVVAAQALSLPGFASQYPPAGSEPPATTVVGQGNVSKAGSATDRQPLEQIDRSLRHGQYDEAENAARIALTTIVASGTGEAELAALYADRLVEALLEGGKWKRPETLGHARFAAETKAQVLGPESVEEARSKGCFMARMGVSRCGEAARAGPGTAATRGDHGRPASPDGPNRDDEGNGSTAHGAYTAHSV